MPASSSRREFLDTVLSASAGIVAVTALAVSVYQAKITREQQKMSAWPRVAQSNSGRDSYARIVMNVGVGPALVRSATLSVDGRPLHTWFDVWQIVVKDTAQIDSLTAHAKATTSSVQRGMVLLPGTTTELIRADTPLAVPLRKFFNDRHTRMRVCYCSVYGDCWISDSRAQEPDPAEVSACPDDAAGEFGS